MDPGVGLDGCCMSFLIWYPMVLFYDPPRDLLNRIQWVQQFRGCPKHGFPPVWYTDDSEALLGILSGGCADEWGSAAPGEAPQWYLLMWSSGLHTQLCPLLTRRVKVQHPAQVYWRDEIGKYEIGLFQTGREGEWTLPEEVGDKEGRWEGQAGNSF